MKRREFLGTTGTAALATLVPGGLWAQSTAPQVIEARVGRAQLAPKDYGDTEIWGFDGQVPGPELRLAQGTRLERRLVNALQQPTTIHWHGLRIPNAMDGVPGVTQQAVEPGESFDYAFDVLDAGTYWYHAHKASTEQVGRGLYGPIVVEESTPPDVDLDQVLVIDDWLLNPETVQIAEGFDAPHSRSHGGRMGNLITTNGQFEFTREVARNDRLRLRVINAANARIFSVGVTGLTGAIVALDGMPLTNPEVLTGEIVLAPGQRADLIVDVTGKVGEEAHLLLTDAQEPISLASFSIGSETRADARDAVEPLPANPHMQEADLNGAARVKLHMQGGAMRGFDSAQLDGKTMDFRTIAQTNNFWALNGTVGMPNDPLAELAVGAALRMEIRNDSVFPHAMHLHGHHFREIQADGSQGPLRDTLLIDGDETREIAFIARTTGDWLFHCHMLSHADAGMMTFLRVTA